VEEKMERSPRDTSRSQCPWPDRNFHWAVEMPQQFPLDFPSASELEDDRINALLGQWKKPGFGESWGGAASPL